MNNKERKSIISQPRIKRFSDFINNKYFVIFLVALIFISALSVRMYYVLDNPDMYANGLGPYGDSPLFHKMGFNIYSGNGFSSSDNGAAFGMVPDDKNIKYEPVIMRAPLYPFFIAVIYKFFCNPKDMESISTWHINWNKVRIAQCVLDAIVCIFVFLIVRSIYPGSYWPAIISAGLQGANLFSIYYTKAILRESATTFFVVLAILLYIKAVQKNKNYWWIIAGMGFGVTILGRTEYTYALVLLVGYVYLINRKVPFDAIKKSLVFVIGLIIVVSPWTVRNIVVFNEFIIVSEPGVGNGLFYGLMDNWHGVGKFPDEIFKDENERKKIELMRKEQIRAQHEGTKANEAIANEFKKIALERIRENPGKAMKTWITTVPRLWYQNYVQRNSIPEPSGNFIIFYFVFAFYAFFRGQRRERNLMWPVLILCIYLTVVSLPLSVTGRYSVPLIPAVISLSGIGIWLALTRLNDLFSQKKPAPDSGSAI